MKKTICFILFVFMLAFCLVVPMPETTAFAENAMPEITSKSAYLVDYQTGTVVFEKNADERLPIASMTKLASLSVVFDYLSKGIIKENDLVTVTETAAAVGGSSAFLDAGSRYKVCDLIKTVVIASANDSTVALAEFVAGSEETFVSKMNKLSNSLRLENTNFVNSTGLPAENHYSSAKDMVEIYKTVCNNPLYKKYSKVWMEDFVHPSGRKTGLVNTNRLVKTFDGIEGGKTGYTDKAKFCLTASAARGNTRLVGVVIGATDSKTRFAEMSKLFSFGFANFETKVIVNGDVPISVASAKNGKNNATVYPEKSIVRFMPKSENLELSTDYEIYEIKAPLAKGEVVGKMFVFDKNNMVVDEVNLVTDTDIQEVGFKERLEKIVGLW
ncbi:MAG: D-alanyl-D-alanine carboxypeptidase [Clostridia bacterium]|nr:D-alanyl-D-alanine carboxypeptidase [Clostridia bacterium]